MADTEKIVKELKKIASIRVLFDEPLKKHTTIKIGGPAKVLIIPKDKIGLLTLLSATKGVKKYIMGNGSKLLMPDKGLNGIVIKISGDMDDLSVKGRSITVGAGMLIQKLINKCISLGLTGMEFAAGVPAAMGGAAVMNLGAFECSMGDIITSVNVIDKNGNESMLSGSDLGFSYRKSGLHGVVVTSVTLSLSYGKKADIEQKIKHHIKWRKVHQPYGTPSAGSIFVNPEGTVAGRLIDEAGMKKLTVGGAEISQKHANFIINKGGAKEKDVKQLIGKVRSRIMKLYHKKLELELVDSSRLNVIF